MSEIGYGYGSEWHLLRHLGYHRNQLNDAIKKLMPDVDDIEWFDHRFNPKLKFYDAEWKGLEFMQPDEPGRIAWESFWPKSGNQPNWDAVALLRIGPDLCWMLVEAKAHKAELKSSCKAKSEGGLDRIADALEETKHAMGVPHEADWLGGYYQYANRLAVLYLLMRENVPSRLLNMYFTGDCNPNGDCPRNEDDWRPAIVAMKQHLKLTGESDLENHTYEMFLPVCDDNRLTSNVEV